MGALTPRERDLQYEQRTSTRYSGGRGGGKARLDESTTNLGSTELKHVEQRSTEM